MITTRDGPTVALRIGDSTMAFEESGEILETVEYFSNGEPDWTNAGICDFRGAGEKEGYDYLKMSLVAAEKNARLAGFEIVRVPVSS